MGASARHLSRARAQNGEQFTGKHHGIACMALVYTWTVGHIYYGAVRNEIHGTFQHQVPSRHGWLPCLHAGTESCKASLETKAVYILHHNLRVYLIMSLHQEESRIFPRTASISHLITSPSSYYPRLCPWNPPDRLLRDTIVESELTYFFAVKLRSKSSSIRFTLPATEIFVAWSVHLWLISSPSSWYLSLCVPDLPHRPLRYLY